MHVDFNDGEIPTKSRKHDLLTDTITHHTHTNDCVCFEHRKNRFFLLSCLRYSIDKDYKFLSNGLNHTIKWESVSIYTKWTSKKGFRTIHLSSI